MRHNQMVLGIDGELHVVADNASPPLIQLSAALMGSSLSHFSQAKIVPAPVGWRC